MFSRRPVRYAEKIDRRKKRVRTVLYIAILIVLCALIRSFALQTWRVRDDLMRPSLEAGDIVLVVPYFMYPGGRPAGIAGSPRVGSIVLVSDGSESVVPFALSAEDAILRFFTLQRFSLVRREFGDDFGMPSFRRVRAVERPSNGRGNGATYLLAIDSSQTTGRTTPERQVQGFRLKGRVVFRIWPLSSMGPVR